MNKVTFDKTVAQEPRLMVGQSLLGVPVLLVEDTLQKLLQDPAAFELKMDQLLGERGSQSGNFHHDSHLFYASLFRAITADKTDASTTASNSGMIADSLKQIEPAGLIAQPDVTYEIHGFGDLTLIAEAHFKPTAPQLFLLQLPKKAVPFAQWLIGQKNWIVKTLGECYFLIGKAQAAFLLDLEPRKLVELPVTSLRHKFRLPYHETTYYRLLKHRSIRIQSPSHSLVLPIAYLLPTRQEILNYDRVAEFNRVMIDELAAKKALSDEDISTLLRGVARRTITKHRDLAGIPSSYDRQKAYDTGRESPYHISLEIDVFLRGDTSL